MQCQNCGTHLSSEMQFCPNCGTATPQAALIDPTAVVSPHQPSPILSTLYAAPSPPSSNTPVPDPYAEYSPPLAYIMPGQQPPYSYNATPPVPNPYQQYAPVPNYHQAQPFPVLPTTPPRKRRTGLIIGMTAAVLMVIVVGLYTIVPKLPSKPTTSDTMTGTQNSTTPTPNVESIPTPALSTNSPSGTTIASTAASIVTDAQTASSIDQTTAAPISLTSTFQTSTNIYVTFKLNNTAFDFSQNTGYVAVKYYANSTLLSLPSNTLLTINRPAPGGFFKIQYYVATQGAAELYWCQQSDCSDEKLAQVVTFTVTD